MSQTPHVIVPCAGFGQRFRDAGYTEDKPLIQIGGKRLIDWSLSCLPTEWLDKVVFITRVDTPQLTDEVSDSFNERHSQCVVIAGPTQGAACTVLAAAVGLPPDEPVLVMNSDQWFRLDPRGNEESRLADVHDWAIKENLDGFVLTFPGTGPAWSYAVTNGTDRIMHIIEKRQVSPHATVGVYWWRRADDLVRSICAMIVAGTKTKGEYYLAPSLGFLPLSDKDVRIVPVDEFHGLGTPEQVKEFETLLATGWKP